MQTLLLREKEREIVSNYLSAILTVSQSLIGECTF